MQTHPLQGGGLASQGYIQAFIDIFMIHALAKK